MKQIEKTTLKIKQFLSKGVVVTTLTSCIFMFFVFVFPLYKQNVQLQKEITQGFNDARLRDIQIKNELDYFKKEAISFVKEKDAEFDKRLIINEQLVVFLRKQNKKEPEHIK